MSDVFEELKKAFGAGYNHKHIFENSKCVICGISVFKVLEQQRKANEQK